MIFKIGDKVRIVKVPEGDAVLDTSYIYTVSGSLPFNKTKISLLEVDNGYRFFESSDFILAHPKEFEQGQEVIPFFYFGGRLKPKTYTVHSYNPCENLIYLEGVENGFNPSYFNIAEPAFEVGDLVSNIDERTSLCGTCTLEEGLRPVEAVLRGGTTKEALRFNRHGGFYLASGFTKVERAGQEFTIGQRVFTKGGTSLCGGLTLRKGFYTISKVSNKGTEIESVSLQRVVGVFLSDFFCDAEKEENMTLESKIIKINEGLTLLRELRSSTKSRQIELYQKAEEGVYSKNATRDLSRANSISLVESVYLRKNKRKEFKLEGHEVTIERHQVIIGCQSFILEDLMKALPKLIEGSWGSFKLNSSNSSLIATRTGIKYNGHHMSWKSVEKLHEELTRNDEGGF